jgi:FtsP/CotA-like multicopper oxidase with cupredoxin domain
VCTAAIEPLADGVRMRRSRPRLGSAWDIRSGTSWEPHEHTDTLALSQGERAILEFTLPERGRYMFHPHQHHLADRGAMGWFAAV